MKCVKGVVCLIIVMVACLLSSQAMAVSPWFVEEMKGEEAILDPGNTTYCNKDFMLENMGDGSAEVQVILGNGANYAFDQLGPRETMEYSLTGDYPLSGGWDGAKGVKNEDARIINSSGTDSKIKVHCK